MKVVELFSYFPSIAPQNLINSESELLRKSVNKIVASSAELESGDIFCAYKGEKADGHNFISEVITKGAVALVVENKDKIPSNCTLPVLIVDDGRMAFEFLCSIYFKHPDQQLYMIGVTGTNGKTSITYLTEYLFSRAGIHTGVMGTVNHRIGEKIWETNLTTPGPWILHQRLKQFQEEKAKAVILEVSSHALDQKRLHSLNFDVAIFTNLTRDHLDYHHTMKEYFKAKEILFYDLMWKSSKMKKMAIVNGDDKFARKIKTPEFVEKVYFGKSPKNDFIFKILKSSYVEQTVELKFGKRKWRFNSPLIGEHSIYNLLAVMILGFKNGMTIEESIRILSLFPGVPGRLQRVVNPQNLNIFIDYAHSPDALKNVLSALNKIKKTGTSKAGKIITVFGCGGDRDKGKRPLMGAIAEKYSDIVIVTSDNPRTEKPEQVIKDILKGMKRKKNIFIEVQREKAIVLAIDKMKAQDVLIICGKGHEDYQIIGTEKKYFRDELEVQKYFSRG